MKKLLFTLMSVAALLGWSTVSAQGTYSKITSADDLVEDGVYLIATAEYGMALGMNFGNNAARENVAVTITNGVISTEVATQPIQASVCKDFRTLLLMYSKRSLSPCLCLLSCSTHVYFRKIPSLHNL